MPREPYALQMLPSAATARVIRKGLFAGLESGIFNQVEEDAAWDIIAQISKALNKET